MSLVEVDENELGGYRQVTQAMQAMLANPKTRRMILEAQKTINPNSVIPELDAAEPLVSEMKSLRQEMAAIANAQKADLEKREQEKQLSALQSQWNQGRKKARSSGYTDEGVEELEKFMESKGIADHEVAMPAFERLHPPEDPVKPVNRFDVFSPAAAAGGEDAMKMLLEGNDEGFLNKVIPNTLSEMRRGR